MRYGLAITSWVSSYFKTECFSLAGMKGNKNIVCASFSNHGLGIASTDNF